MAPPVSGGKDLAAEVRKLEAEFLSSKREQQGARSRAQSAGAVVGAAVGSRSGLKTNSVEESKVGSGGKSKEREALASSSWEQ